ncbi:amidohydrolase family-domain-containing protein [Microdochium trichocladiopsis]|uniref:Amidohydrolase family-domain-containing protein n=1 Tax=Microdochium trichocladiopsis TaxID=1682393 RepID=A0A9P9BQ17_9PEZI|nr:amidohydrolase family-domain-containing protein [Microdochium trichocladiopsis]KAH7029740.1 amidohydrolase family-domain-containing protein [Microdochium trichocladiopsis]
MAFSVKTDVVIRAKRTCLGLVEDFNGLDDAVGPDTRAKDVPEQTVLPAFDDTNTHMIFAGLSQFDVPVHLATSIDEMTWWPQHCGQLARPQAGAINADTPTPADGKIGRSTNSRLNGHLQDQAMVPTLCLMPPATLEDRISGLESTSAAYAASGIGCVRDCAVPVTDLPILSAARAAGKLHVRTRALVSAIGLTSVGAVAGLVDQMEEYRHLQRDEWLSVWGVKFVLDGGIEAIATMEGYVGRPDEGCCVATDFCGVLVGYRQDTRGHGRCGWRIGTDAYGDRAIETLLGVYEKIQQRHPHLAPGSLVMEHGGLADAGTQARAVAMGIPVTIQLPLLHDVAAIQALYIGEERTARLFPARSWLDAGAIVGGGSDYPIGKFGAMRSVWVMTTRESVAGVVGPEHIIKSHEAVALHTTEAARLLRETDSRGDLTPGKVADITIWPRDPLAVSDPYDLRDLEPTYTIIGGELKHEPKTT